MKKIVVPEFHHGALNTIFSAICAGKALKFQKVDPTFLWFNPSPSKATDDDRKQV